MSRDQLYAAVTGELDRLLQMSGGHNTIGVIAGTAQGIVDAVLDFQPDATQPTEGEDA